MNINVKKVEAVEKIKTAFKSSEIDFITEYQFLKGSRQFRFDFLITAVEGKNLFSNGIKIAVEYEGGTYTKGGHVRGFKYAKDCEKYNLAQLNGFYILRYTADYLNKKNGEYLIAEEIKNLVRQIETGFITKVYTDYFRAKKKWKIPKQSVIL